MPSPILARGQRADEVLEASAGNDAAVAAYRLSVQAGNPLSERRLAQMFGRTSRRWARARIAEARQESPPPDSPRILIPVYVDVRPPVQDCTRASMRSVAWRPATSAPAVTTHGNLTARLP